MNTERDLSELCREMPVIKTLGSLIHLCTAHIMDMVKGVIQKNIPKIMQIFVLVFV